MRNEPPRQVMFTLLELTNDKDRNTSIIRNLREAHTLIGYLTSAPHPRTQSVWQSIEHSSLHLFMPDRFPRIVLWNRARSETTGELLPDPKGWVSGFDTWLYWRTRVYLHKTDRIYPPSYTIFPSGDLSRLIQAYTSHPSNWAMTRLLWGTGSEAIGIERRIFTAMRWYNLSTSDNTDEDRLLVDLATAFECLLDLKQGGALTERFTETVRILLGSTPRLEDWLRQFYDVRSEIVHRGYATSLMFQAPNASQFSKRGIPKVPYRSLIDDGRRLFRLCLNLILSGAMLAHDSNLSSLLMHNQERLENICKEINQSTKRPAERLENVRKAVEELSEYTWESAEHTDLDLIVETGRQLIGTFLETDPVLNSEVSGLLNAILENPQKRTAKERLQLFKQLAELQGRWKGTEDPIDTADASYVVHLFAAYAGRPHRWWKFDESE
jgi:hypothetical protein